MKITQRALAALSITTLSLSGTLLAQDEKKETNEKPAAEAKESAEEKGEEAREIVLKQDKTNPLAFAEKEFTAKAGEKIKLTLDNSTASVPQPHNVLVCEPGSLKEIMALATSSLTDPAYMTGGCVVKSEKVLHALKLVQPGQKDSIEFEAPADAGEYPFVCTFPGHWMTMNGIMKVEAADGEKEGEGDKKEGEKKEAKKEKGKKKAE